jgi:colanic acid biosynthesis glycosyl transferase WcaI
MRLVFFNRFFFPDTSATSQILTDLAFHLAAAGREVHVVTSSVPGGMASTEVIRGLTVHRVAHSVAGPHGIARRGIAYLAYYAGARRAAARLLRAGDVAIVKTDPPLLSAAIAPIAQARGARFVVWLQDLFPEVAREYGIPGMSGPGGSVLRALRNRSLARADRVVAIGDRMAQRVRALRCVPDERLEVIHNWADGDAIVPVARDSNPLRREWGLRDKFVVGYSGNLGRVHEFGTILDAATKLRGHEEIHFVFIGRGPRLEEVRRRVSREALANVSFRPHQDRRLLAQSLGVADVHLSVLQSEFEGLVHPSKVYGIMAAGRPTVFIGEPAGETGMILARAAGGTTVATSDADALAREIRRLCDDPTERERMGRSARDAFEACYDMKHGLRRWEAALHL